MVQINFQTLLRYQNVCPFLSRSSPAALRQITYQSADNAVGATCPIVGKALAVHTANALASKDVQDCKSTAGRRNFTLCSKAPASVLDPARKTVYAKVLARPIEPCN